MYQSRFRCSLLQALHNRHKTMTCKRNLLTYSNLKLNKDNDDIHKYIQSNDKKVQYQFPCGNLTEVQIQ